MSDRLDPQWNPDFDFQLPTGEMVSLEPDRALKFAIELGRQLVGAERVAQERERHDQHEQSDYLIPPEERPLRPDDLVVKSTLILEDALALTNEDCPAYCDEQLPAACKRPWGGTRMYWVCDHVPNSHSQPYP